jgi:hypothetical protein
MNESNRATEPYRDGGALGMSSSDWSGFRPPAHLPWYQR